SAADAIRATLETDTFETALALDAVLVADERTAAGATVHRPVDPRVLVVIGAVLDLRDIDPALPLYDRMIAMQERIEALPVTRRAELVTALVADRVRVPWRPDRGSQCLAFERASEVDVLLLAGSAGGGKSEAAIGIGL